MNTTPDLHISADVLNRIAAEVHGAKVAQLLALADKWDGLAEANDAEADRCQRLAEMADTESGFDFNCDRAAHARDMRNVYARHAREIREALA